MKPFLTIPEILKIIVEECRNGCTEPMNAFAYFMQHYKNQFDETHLRALLQSLNFAYIRESDKTLLEMMEA